MKIDTTEPLIDLDGEPLVELDKDKKPKTLTVGSAIMTALLQETKDEMPLSGEEKMKRFLLAKRCMKPQVELTLEEAVMIKTHAARVFNNLGYGLLAEKLEEASN